MLFFLFLLLSTFSVTKSIKDNGRIDGVVLTSGHTRVFEKSLLSAIKYLVDLDIIYVLAPKAEKLKEDYKGKFPVDKVVFVDESIFPINWINVSEVMIQSVADKGVYPLNGKSQFEHTVYGKVGWYLQQLLKLYAGRILNIDDFVLLDSDLVWMKNVSFIHESRGKLSSFYYASSTQYHPPYMASLVRIGGVDVYENRTEKLHRSGIVHHMVVVKTVLEELIATSEAKHGLPFWQVVLNHSAVEMTCRAPRTGICGGGSTLSEYEMYFNYAKTKFPQTIQYRPLLWTNGPAPGHLFWPPEDEPFTNPQTIHGDSYRNNWMGHRQADVMEVLDKQILADAAAGFAFVGYHSYARRRYFELHGVDIEALCGKTGDPPSPSFDRDQASPTTHNSTCSYKGMERENAAGANHTVESWFAGCGCHMAR